MTARRRFKVFLVGATLLSLAVFGGRHLFVRDHRTEELVANPAQTTALPPAGEPAAPQALLRHGGAMVEEAWRTGGDGVRERWRLWRREGDDTPWIVSREEFPRGSAPGAPAAPGAWAAWAADRVLIEVQDANVVADAVSFVERQAMQPAMRATFSLVWRAQLAAPSLDAADAALLALNAALPEGARAARDYLLFPTAAPNDAQYASQWALPRIRAPEAWDAGTGSASVVVAVIDTGFDFGHGDLAPNVFNNSGEAGPLAANGRDDDGNGLIDDRRGWDWPQNDNLPQDTQGHGTAVAGIIGAAGNNAIGVAGVAWTARVLPLRAGAADFPLSNLIQAIDYAIDLRARHGLHLVAINLSLGGYIPDARPGGDAGDLFFAALVRARDAGVLVIAAAGNDAVNVDMTPFFPACYTLDNIIAVCGTDQPDALDQDRLYASTNYGPISIDLGAPAVTIRTTALGGSYTNFTGTSAAAPLVAGAVAVAVAQSGPLPLAEARKVILGSVDSQPILLTRCGTGGRLDLRDLAQAARLSAWRISTWGPDYAANPESDNVADADGDRVPNLVEFFRGTPATGLSSAPVREVTFMMAVGGPGHVCEFSYWRAPAARHLSSVIETATELASPGAWVPVTLLTTAVVETERVSGAERVLARIAAVESEPKRFFRLRVTSKTD